MLTISCPAECNANMLSIVLMEIGAQAVHVPDVVNKVRSGGRGRPSPCAAVKAHMPSGAMTPSDAMKVLESAIAAPEPLQYTVAASDEQGMTTDWVQRVQQQWPPVRLTTDIVVSFPWHSAEDVGRTCGGMPCSVVRLEGGEAFGAGDHVTTLMCASWVQEKVRLLESDTSPCSMLDYGCGSGILAIVARVCGARGRVVGVDVDPKVVSSAKRNAALNGFSSIEFYRPRADVQGGELWDGVITTEGCSQQVVPELPLGHSRSYQIVAANIFAGVLVSVVRTLADLTRPGGVLALTGVLEDKAEEVASAYSEYFWDVSVVALRDGWVLLEGIRK